jgi:hypothetical protein
MEEISALNESHGIRVKGGKKYTQVVHRMETFRKFYELEYGVNTDIREFMGGALCKAKITIADFIIGSGHAFSASLSDEKSIEKLETTAIGRALASIGLSGGEYASINEIDTWEERYKDESIMPKSTYDNYINMVRGEVNLESFEELKTTIRGLWSDMSLHQKDKMTKEINAKQQDLENRELDRVFEDKVLAE